MPREVLAVLEGRVFEGELSGFAAPLRVAAPRDGMCGEAELLPWTYAAHMAALSACARVAPGGGLALDRAAFAARVLAASGLGADEHGWLAPLALWWAAGGDDPPVEPPRALRPWTEGERLAALAAACRAGAGWLDAVGYLDAMVRRSAPEPPDGLDSRATASLLAAVVALNAPDPSRDPLLSGEWPEAAARSTLALCRALGWTPAQVLATPAAEVQRLMALCGIRAGGASAAVPRSAPSGLAAQPGSVSFVFAEDFSP